MSLFRRPLARQVILRGPGFQSQPADVWWHMGSDGPRAWATVRLASGRAVDQMSTDGGKTWRPFAEGDRHSAR